MKRVRIESWKKGAVTISAIKEVQACTSLGLAGSKHCIEEVLAGRTVEVSPVSEHRAEELAAKLRTFQFVATVVKTPEEPIQSPQTTTGSSAPDRV